MPNQYFRIKAGPDNEKGIIGGIGSICDAPQSGGKLMTQITVPVADLDKVLADVIEVGGRVVEQRFSIPGIG